MYSLAQKSKSLATTCLVAGCRLPHAPNSRSYQILRRQRESDPATLRRILNRGGSGLCPLQLMDAQERLQIGAEVQVYYNPEDPSDSTLVLPSYTHAVKSAVSAFLFWLAGLFFSLSLFFAAKMLYYRSRPESEAK